MVNNVNNDLGGIPQESPTSCLDYDIATALAKYTQIFGLLLHWENNI